MINCLSFHKEYGILMRKNKVLEKKEQGSHDDFFGNLIF